MTQAEESTLSTAPQRALVHALERLGWQLVSAEVDLCGATARVELRQGDLVVTLDARHGRATITRERIRVVTTVVGRRGDKCRVERLHTELLGRTRHEGIRCALRSLSNYVEDNASTPTRRFAARPAFALLLGGS